MISHVIKEAMRRGIPVEIIYQRDKEITQRVIDIKQINDNKIKAYCRTKKAIRHFNIENILAASLYNEGEINDLKKY